MADPETIDLGRPVAHQPAPSLDLTSGVLDDTSFGSVLGCAMELAQDADTEITLGLLVVADPTPPIIQLVADSLRAVDAIGLLDDGAIAILFGTGSRLGAAAALRRTAETIGATPGCGDVQAVLTHRSGPVDTTEDLVSATRAQLAAPSPNGQSEVRARR